MGVITNFRDFRQQTVNKFSPSFEPVSWPTELFGRLRSTGVLLPTFSCGASSDPNYRTVLQKLLKPS